MNHTMAKQICKSVSIAGSSDKHSIIGTFTITLNGHFLPMQLIYGGKTKQSLPRFKFPDGVALSSNPKHFSNAMKSIKLINEIIIPYLQTQRKELGKPKQVALVIMDVFRCQITDDVISLLGDNNIHYVLVPNDMTQLFQPLNLTVNKHRKSYLKRLFSEWYAKQIENQLFLGKKFEEIKIEFRLTTSKTTLRQMVGRILQRNYVRKWFIRYHKYPESSGYIRCYKGWVFRATINWSIWRYPTSCHRT